MVDQVILDRYGNFQDQRTDLATQMKGDQVPPELDVDNEVQVSTTASTFKHPESTIESKQQEASILEESSTVNEDPNLDEVQNC
ncbi:hypothetical protein CMV_005593 [Castanea mollissima]|uniref:Uncharacterized protein n=1 Tax=Castanea mollissima TaxID=60419 RepID=A0A8J4RWS5_9ROSI|nr:hypothetical protein CMV_005593 [Castanea mollissima]